MMWYGVLGTKELLQRTYKNLEQRVQLEVLQRWLPFLPEGGWLSKHQSLSLLIGTSCQEKGAAWSSLQALRPLCALRNGCSVLLSTLFQCDGVPISLPSLQGIAVLNIPSYAGGINFWGGTKEDSVSFWH